MSNASPFPSLTIGETVYINSQATQSGTWRPAIVTSISTETITCTALVQEGLAGKWSPHENVRWHQDAKLVSDMKFAAIHAEDEAAGVFRLSDERVLREQMAEALLSAVSLLAADGKDNKKQALAIIEQLQGIEPVSSIPQEKPSVVQDDWRISKVKAPAVPQTAEQRAAVLAAAE